jgi:hypothetical protein
VWLTSEGIGKGCTFSFGIPVLFTEDDGLEGGAQLPPTSPMNRGLSRLMMGPLGARARSSNHSSGSPVIASSLKSNNAGNGNNGSKVAHVLHSSSSSTTNMGVPTAADLGAQAWSQVMRHSSLNSVNRPLPMSRSTSLMPAGQSTKGMLQSSFLLEAQRQSQSQSLVSASVDEYARYYPKPGQTPVSPSVGGTVLSNKIFRRASSSSRWERGNLLSAFVGPSTNAHSTDSVRAVE